MKKGLLYITLLLLLISTSSCERTRYHVYSLEIQNNTNREVRFVTNVKLGADSDGYLSPMTDTILYTERRMSKDWDGPATFLSEYYSIVSFYFTGIASYVTLSDVSDPSGIKSEYNYFVHDDAWDFEIRAVRVPAKGWPDEQYYYTINITEDKLLFSLK